jgi:hypothetical protein
MATNILKSITSARTKTRRTKTAASKAISAKSAQLHTILLTNKTAEKTQYYKIPKTIFKTLKKYEVTDHETFDTISIDGLMKKLSTGLPEWAENLKGLRLREGMTQVEFGEKLGIEQSNISAMERGKRPIGKEFAQKIARKFNIDYRLLL